MTETILWRRVDQPGHDAARLRRADAGWLLSGVAVLGHEGMPCCFEYEIACDEQWRTIRALVSGWMGDASIDHRIERTGELWRFNGEERPSVSGSLDVDLAFTPATNTLPIRRLGLSSGESADVRAAWLRFPELVLEPLEQSYTRLDDRTYRYESGGGTFVRRLTVSRSGLVLSYPGLWEMVAHSGARA